MTDLTPRQSEILGYIRESISLKGYPPTVREIGAKFGINSPNGVMCHLKALEKKGSIVRDSNIDRGIRIVNAAYLDISGLSPQRQDDMRRLVRLALEAGQ